MKLRTLWLGLALTLLSGQFLCAQSAKLAQAAQSGRPPFIRTDAPLVALTNVRVIDGTGAALREDQTIIISAGKIQAIAPSASANVFKHGGQFFAALSRARRHDHAHRRQRPAIR